MKKKSSGLLFVSLLFVAACSTAKPASAPTPAPVTEADVCAKLAQLHAQQKQAHEAAATIKDPTMQPGIQRMMDDMDNVVAGADRRVIEQGVRCK